MNGLLNGVKRPGEGKGNRHNKEAKRAGAPDFRAIIDGIYRAGEDVGFALARGTSGEAEIAPTGERYSYRVRPHVELLVIEGIGYPIRMSFGVSSAPGVKLVPKEMLMYFPEEAYGRLTLEQAEASVGATLNSLARGMTGEVHHGPARISAEDRGDFRIHRSWHIHGVGKNFAHTFATYGVGTDKETGGKAVCLSVQSRYGSPHFEHKKEHLAEIAGALWRGAYEGKEG